MGWTSSSEQNDTSRSISANELKALYLAADWGRICSDCGLPLAYNGFPSAGMLAAHVLPYLIPLASERGVARILAEHELLQSLCLLDEEQGIPSRATLWHFRRRFFKHFRDALVSVLVLMENKAQAMGISLPFVSPHLSDCQFFDRRSISVNGRAAAVWFSQPRSSLTDKEKHRVKAEAEEEQVFLPLIDMRRNQRQPRKHRYGLADEIGFPIRVQLADEGLGSSDLYLVKPWWLHLSAHPKDPLTTIGPSHVQKSYTACNVLVLRIREGKEQALLGLRLTGYGRGDYAIPGGKKRSNETVQECAVRELREETGLRLHSSTPISVVENNLLGRQVVTSVGVLADDYSGEPANRESEQMGPWKWFPLSGLPDNLFPPSRWVIEAYLDPDRRTILWVEIDRPVEVDKSDESLELWEGTGT